MNGSNTLWVVDWEYNLGELTPGSYPVHFEENVRKPFSDGADYDGDGRRDFFDWHTSVDFNVLVAMEGGSISGTVTQQDTEILIAGMEVAACPYEYEDGMPCYSGWTEADGSYLISGVPAGTYRADSGWSGNWVVELYAEQTDWDLADPVVVEADVNTPDIDFTLELGGSISGMVTEQGTDNPIEGMEVAACPYDYEDGMPCYSGWAEANGSYFIRGVPAGTYRVNSGWSGDWIPEYYSGQTDWDLANPVVVKTDVNTPDIDFTLVLGGSISGRVTSEYGEPISGLWVDACEYDTQLYCASAPTDNDGYYSISVLPGEYWVQVWVDRDWIGQEYDVDPQDGEPDRVPVLVGEDTGGIDFELLAAGMISGRVTSEYGDPLSGLWVDACEYETESFCNSAETNDDGNYAILLPPGEYWVQVWVEQDWIGQRYDADQDGEPDRVLVLVGEDTGGIDFELLAAP